MLAPSEFSESELSKPHNIAMWRNLFEAVKLFVFTAGGDGDGWIVTEFYKEVAYLFEEYQKQREELNYSRCEYENERQIVYTFDQEMIVFLGDKSLLPEWAGDIVVEI